MIKQILSTKCAAVLLLMSCLITIACGIEFNSGSSGTIAPKGYLAGTITDSAGNPLEAVKIVVDHSIIYNSTITALTDAGGKYRIKIPNGSWYAFAHLNKNYNGKTYRLDMQPDNYAGFGGEGAIRNFTWVLTGKKEEPLAKGFFGGTITFDNFPTGNYVTDKKGIEFTLKPVGSLIDGSGGKTLIVRSTDGYQLEDIPIGRYDVSASYQGKPIKLRKWRTDDEFSKTLRADFEPLIQSQCENCLMLEYYY